MITEHHIPVSRQARYCTLGDPEAPVTELWYVLHGYGQLAPYFLRKFQPVQQPGRLIVAPEGPHRFYLNGHSGRVGASWMTKEDRETDIRNYIHLLDTLHHHFTGNWGKVPVRVLGFSQGAATASRWVNYGQIEPAALCLWASVFPPDMEFRMDRLQCPLYLVYADNDEFLTLQQTHDHIAFLQNKGLDPHVIRFSGTHDIPHEALKNLADKW
jgi:predicted esterase